MRRRLVESFRKSWAVELLTRADCSVAEVCNFRKVFTRWTGVTRTEIRESESA